jgi:uncharacterized protein (TIGR02145 family)
MRLRTFYLMLTLLMTGAASVNAQVLIGGTASDEPHSGAILDLASGGQNNLGMLLPNVPLTNDATAFVLVANADDNVKQTATGMIVYNTEDVLSGAGLYVWNGFKWNVIVCVPVETGPMTLSTPVIELGEPFTASVPEVAGATAYEWTLPAGLTGASSTSTPEITITASVAGEYPAGSIKVKPVRACGATTEQNSIASIVACPTTVRDAQGNWYCTAEFGTAGTWMTQNMRYKPADNNVFRYPNNEATVFEAHPEYGLLYDWATAKTICPDGWHLPTSSEWGNLRTEIEKDVARRYSTLTTDNDRQKMTSVKGVNGEYSDGYSKGCYENGFDALLTGWYDIATDEMINYGEGTHYTSSSSAILIFPESHWSFTLIRTNVHGEVHSVNTSDPEKPLMETVRCKQTP